MAVSRLQRWAIILSAYAYTISYKHTKEHGNANCLSRLPQEPTRAPILTWEDPTDPWKRLHIDFAGPFEGSM